MPETFIHRYPVTEEYLAIRKSAFDIPIERFQKFIDANKFKVYGAAIDIPVAPQVVATLIVFINGAANIYFNRGEKYENASTKYVSVVKAAQSLIYQCNKCLDKAELTPMIDLPHDASYNVYMMNVNRKVYKLSYNVSDVAASDDEDMKILNYAVQNVMKEIHNAQIEDGNLKKRETITVTTKNKK